MKFLFLLLSILPSQAGNWLTITPDHFNSLYSVGEQADLLFRVKNAPVNPEYSLSVTVDDGSTLVDLPLVGGIGHYLTPSLSVGAHSYHVVVTLHNAANTWEQIVQDETIALQVIE